MIQINPLKSYIDGGVRAALTTPPSASLVFDLPGKAIWVKGVKLKGTDHTYTFSHDNYITLTNTPDSNESEDIKIGVNTSALKNAIDTTYGVVSTTANGLAPKFTSGNKLAAAAATTYYFLGWAGTTLKWYQAPFRNVRINSETTDCLGVNNTDPLIISSGNGISVTWDSTNKKIIITNTKPDINHNTDTKVALSVTTLNKNYAIILKGNDSDEGSITTVNFSTYLKFNPSTKQLTINGNKVITTIDTFVGATTSADGSVGLVTKPLIANRLLFLRGDGTWATPTDTWRPVKVEGTEKLGSNALDLSAGNGISIIYNSNTKKIIITNTKPDVNHNTHYTTMLYIGENNDTKTNKNVANPYLKLFDDNARRATFQIKAGNGIAVASDANGNITITNSSPDVNHNTDERVKQVPKTDNINRPLMMINGGTSTGEQINTSMFSTGIYANASTKMITANGFIKAGSSNSYVLLGGGGHKVVSDFATSGHNHDGRYVYNYGGTQMDGASINKNALGMTTNSGITRDWWHILQAAWNGEYRWNSLIAFPTLNRNGMYYRSGLDDNTKWGSWVKLLDVNNYSSTLDSRYYTESEVNNLLNAKLNRQNLSYGTWNPRGYNLAADYYYNGGDLSISESGGKIHVSVDGYFWLNEGQYRVLDTSDVAGLKSNLTVNLYLSSTDATWWPILWGGSAHNNTNTSTGTIYKSYDKLSWLTSSLTLYATNIQTSNIKNLSVGGGIYWNPYVESTTDGSDAASITLVKSGVAGGTTLVLSLMNDANDTILFKTSTAARLYHNSYPILTTLNTYINNNKGYINGTEITLVNNSDKVDGYHASSLWRSDGAIWNPNANVTLNASASSQEWSFDIRRNGYTGCYWHVWDSSLSTMLKVNADNGKVYAPYNFVGNLEGNASSATYLNIQYCRDDNYPSNKGLWNTIKNGTTNAITNRVRFYTIYGSSSNLGAPETYGELLEICSYNSNHWQPLLWFGAGTGGRLYYRNKNYNNDTWGAWRTLAWTSDIPTVTNYYWANIKVSASSNAYTTPQFGNVTICDGTNSFLYLKTAAAGAYAYLAAYNTGGQYGADVILHSGSAMILGAGESAAAMYSNNVDSLRGSENLYLTADGNIKIFANCDSIANRKYVACFDTTGYTYFNSYINIGGHEKNASSPTYVWGSNASDNFLRSYQTNKLSVSYASSSGNADTIDGYHASWFKQSWTARIQGNSWSRLYLGTASTLHHASIFSIEGSIGCVVFSGTFLVIGNHSTNAQIICLANGNYTLPLMRVLVDSPGNVLIDMYWIGNDCNTSSSSQQMSIVVHCIPLKGGINPCTSFTNDSTVPSGYNIAHSYGLEPNTSVFRRLKCTDVIYATHFYENSDIRYKKILRNLLINSNTIATLPLFDFEWIENNTIGTGTSAQAVQEILPNIVSGTDKLTLDYGVLGTIAGITACKELVNLKSELLRLKEKVKLLEDKLRKYENTL